MEGEEMGVATAAAMLIDSDERMRSLMRAKLVSAGIEVELERAHGIAAQQAIEQYRPSLVFVAVEPPVQRAMQVIEFTRGLVPSAVLVAYSASWSPTVERRLMQEGVTDFLHGKIDRKHLASIAARARRRTALPEPEAEAESPAAGRIVAVVGPKGGIGKTTTSTNIAAAVAREGSRTVLLLDLDTRFGDVAVMLDVRPEYTVSEVARDPDYLKPEVFRTVLLRHESGAYVLPSPRDYRSWLNCSPDQLRAMIRFAATMFDVVVLDTPGTFNDVVDAAAGLADRIVMVTSTDPASLKNTSLLLDLLGAREAEPGKVAIALIHGHPGRGGLSTQDVEQAIRRPVDFEVPFDRNVQKAAQLGVPVVMHRPKTPAAVALGGLAAQVAGLSTPEPVGSRFFRVFGPRRTGSPRDSQGKHIAV